MIMTGLLIILWNLEKCSARSDNVPFQYNVICIYIRISHGVIHAPYNYNVYIWLSILYYLSIFGTGSKNIILILNICYFERFYREKPQNYIGRTKFCPPDATQRNKRKIKMLKNHRYYIFRLGICIFYGYFNQFVTKLIDYQLIIPLTSIRYVYIVNYQSYISKVQHAD